MPDLVSLHSLPAWSRQAVLLRDLGEAGGHVHGVGEMVLVVFTGGCRTLNLSHCLAGVGSFLRAGPLPDSLLLGGSASSLLLSCLLDYFAGSSLLLTLVNSRLL